MNPAILFDRVTIRLRGRTIIEDFSARFDPGDFVALIGSNGSGKTTMLRAVMGFVPLAAGALALFGSPAASPAYFLHRRRVAYVPQAPVLDFKMPVLVRDVVSMGRYGLRGLCRRLTREDRRMIEASMNDAGIAGLADRPIGHLSGGERQKVQIARALCQSPEVLLLDEPTSNLDMGAQHECLDLVGDIHERSGITTVIVMHDLQALPRRCERAVIIDGGRKVFDGRLSNVFTRDNLSHIYKERAERVMRELAASAPEGVRCS